MTKYAGLHSKDIEALSMNRDEIIERASVPLTIHDSMEVMLSALIARFKADYEEAVSNGKQSLSFIMPVGPVGQYPEIAKFLNTNASDTMKLTIVFMDEYLNLDNTFISEDDGLSFRGHIKRNFIDLLTPDQCEQVEVIFPDPQTPQLVTEKLERIGLDYCYAGVGITGHLAFNDPVPGLTDPNAFAALPTRIVSLCQDTRVINSVTACNGNISRIPHLAVTVGMKEILSATTIRVWMNRTWQCAALRRLLFGEVSATFPATLLQQHPNVTLDIVENVLEQPEPALR